jgi:hypothetical protein
VLCVCVCFIFTCATMVAASKYHLRRRPYRVECTGSLPTSEVKRRRAQLVLGWGTAWEHFRVLSAFCFFFASSVAKGPCSMVGACLPWQASTCRCRLACRGSRRMLGRRLALPSISRAFTLVVARKLTTTREILLWMTPSEAPKALQASECSELLDPMRASCWISAQH